MITYEYQCEECQYNFEAEQSIKDEPLHDCPECGYEGSLQRLIGQPYFSVRGEATTVGHLAERNTKKLGTYGLQEKEQARVDNEAKAKEYAISNIPGAVPAPDKKSLKQPWYNDSNVSNKKLNSMTEKQKQKYIMEGKL